MREPCDRTAEVKAVDCKLEIRRNDFCDAYKMDDSRLFCGRECWYCVFGDFDKEGMDLPTQGYCKF